MKHVFALLTCHLLALGGARAQTPVPVVAPPTGPASLSFLPNRGQWHPAVRLAADVPGGRLFLTDAGFTYAFVTGLPRHPAAAAPTALRACAVQMQFVGANGRPTVAGEAPNGDVRNYFHGNNPKHWAARVPGYGRAHYRALWPGVDAVLYEHAQGLEYDFRVAPQADPAAVALRYAGTAAPTLDREGNLHLSTPLGELRELAPRAWTTDAAGRRHPVACRYQLAGATVRFALGAYDKSQALTIDPTVIFSSFTGSTADNWGFTATYDQAGNLYSGGIVFGLGFPVTPGAYSPTFNGTTDGFGGALDCDMAFIKYNPRVSGPAARVWATYLGGNSTEFPHSIVTNARGELVILGTTSSPNFPTSAGAYQRVFRGGPTFSPYSAPPLPGFPPFVLGPPYDLPNGSDLVLARLSARGDSLLASTFLGGTANDGLLSVESPQPRLCHNYGDYFRGDVLLDATGNVYVASTTTSTNFPTANSFGPTYHGGPTDAVVASLTPNLGSLRFSTLLGGSGADAAYSLQRNPAGDIFVAGGTTSANFPATAGALQPTAGGDVDGFVVRLSPSGSTLTHATYLGTSSYDQAYFLQLDTQGEVYLLGQTLGTVPITPGHYGNARSGQYVQKLSAALDTLRFSTVFGTGNDSINISPTAFLVDQCNRVYISGWGGGENQNDRFGFANGSVFGMPLTPNAVQRTTDGADFYLAQFGPDMSRLQYATYLGSDGGEGDHVDGGTCRFDPRGFIYHAVCSCGQQGTGFPIPPGANTYTAVKGFFNCNNAAFKINFGSVPIAAGTDTLVCSTGAPVPLRGSPLGGTWTGPGVTGNATTGYFFTPTPALLGFQNLTYAVLADSVCGESAPLRIHVQPPPMVGLAALPQARYCRGRSGPQVPLSGSPAGGMFSGPGVTGNQFDPVAAGPGQHTITYTYTAPNLNCPVAATRPVTVVDSVVVRLPLDTVVCADAGTVRLRALPPGGTWAGAGVSGSPTTGFAFSPSAALLGLQTLTYTAPNAGACGGVAQRRFQVVPVVVASIAPLPVLTGTPNVFCPAAGLVPLVGSPAGGTFSGPGVAAGTAVFNPGLAGAGAHVISYQYAGANGCPARATVNVTVLPSVPVPLLRDTTLCATGGPLALPLLALPGGGGGWTGPGVSGGPGAGYVFTPAASLLGRQTLTYVAPGANVCGGTARVLVTVVATPVASAAVPSAGTVFCPIDAPVPLTGFPAGGTWTGPGVTNNAFIPGAANTGDNQLTYIFRDPALDCPALATLVLTVRPVLAVQLPPDTVLCPGATGAVALTGTPAGGVWTGPGVSGNATAGFVFEAASLPGGSALLTYTPPATACAAPATRRISVAVVPAFRPAYAGPRCPDALAAPRELVFTDAAGNESTRWDFGDGTPAATGATVAHAYAQPGTYRPLATLPYGPGGACAVQQALPAVEVKPLFLPNVITPNGDGFNDAFRPTFACLPHLQIFSRWGQLVYESTAYANDWAAADQPAGTYYYRLDDGSGHAQHGWVEVLK